MLRIHQGAKREAPTVFSRLPSLMAANKPCPLLQPSLPKGTLISNENPQLKCRKDGDWMQDLMAAFMAMSKENQEAFMNLYDDRNNIVIDRNLELCNENTLKWISREFGLEKGKYDVTGKSLPEALLMQNMGRTCCVQKLF